MIFLIAVSFAGPPERPAVDYDPVAQQAAPGSLLSPEVEARITERRSVGSLVTVQIDETTIATVEAETKTSVTSTQDGSVESAFGIVGQWRRDNPNMEHNQDDGGVGYATDRNGEFSGSGDTSRNSSTQAVITCEVIEVLPGGRLRIWGYKAVRANGETQYLEVSGVVREEDIDLNNVVISARMAEANIELTGEGVIDDRQEPGAGTRVIDNLWPF